MNKFDEQILVVKRDTILKDEFQGFKQLKDAQSILNSFDHIEVKRRGDMEDDPTYKQLISYVIVMNSKNQTLCYTRLTGGGEERLHGFSSIGIGGHMNDDESIQSKDELLLENARRELLEEIGVNPAQLGLLGFINDDSNDVGKVHIGLVFLAYIGDEQIHITETDTLDVEWLTTTEGKNFETWSEILVGVGLV